MSVVLAELLQGCRTPKEADTIVSTLTGLRYPETSLASWKRSGELSFALRRKGVALPLSDLIIAALALEHHCQVYALDPHFEQIPGLTLYAIPPPRRRRYP